MASRIRHILLVDDDPDDRNLFAFGISSWYPDVRITVTENCEEMLQVLQNSDDKDLPDVIVIDYHMPVMNGPQCLKATNHSTPYGHIPKVVWSTSRRRQEAQECLALGASRFIPKPGSLAELNDLIKSLESVPD